MKKRTHRLISLLLAGLLLMSLLTAAACSAKKQDAETSEEVRAQASEPETEALPDESREAEQTEALLSEEPRTEAPQTEAAQTEEPQTEEPTEEPTEEEIEEPLGGPVQHALGAIPAEIEGDRVITDAIIKGDKNTLDKLMVASSTRLPAKYDSRDYGYVTAVRNQGSFGTCWSFSAMACVETYMIKHGVVNADTGKAATKDINLSELHHAWFAYTNAYDRFNLLKGDATATSSRRSDGYLNQGGNSLLSSFTLMRWEGPASEQTTALQYGKAGSTTSLNSSYAYSKNIAHVTDAEWIYTANRSAVKQALMEYGACTIGFYYDEACFNSRNAAFCCKQSASKGSSGYKPLNHFVTIVGWDDNFSKSNFKSSYGPKGNGAWICKNSWGTSWGKNGYFYLSYEDTTAFDGTCVFFKVADVNNYANCYQYDGTGNMVSQKRLSNNSMVSNVFKTRGNEQLKAVAIALSDEATSYTVEIYKNPSSVSKPTSGTLMCSQKGYFENRGYYTIKLNKTVSLSAGDKFAVVFTLSTPSASSGSIHMLYDDSSSVSWCAFSNAGQGCSYYKEPSGSWTACPNKGDFRIKAYTSDAGYYLDLNGILNDQYYDNIRGCATADIYINGTRVANDVTDYYDMVPSGATYAIKDIKPKSGYNYYGELNDVLSGTVGSSDVKVWLCFTTEKSKGLVQLSPAKKEVKAGKTAQITCSVSKKVTGQWEVMCFIYDFDAECTVQGSWKDWNGQSGTLEFTSRKATGASIMAVLYYPKTGEIIDQAFATVIFN